MRDIIEQIITAGVAAPSGDNCQPWRFVVREQTIDVFNIPERDQSLYSWGQRASLIAHGALLENMRIAAAHQGYRAQIELLTGSGDSNLVSRVSLTSAQKTHEPLFDAIAKRATNRKPYHPTPLTSEQRESILHAPDEVGGGKLLLIEDKVSRAALGKVAAANETILFENKLMHSFFFGHINWTPQKTGMHIDTLELPPPAKLGFKVFKKWNALQILNKLGLSKLVAFGNAKIYATGATMGAIILRDRSPEQFITAGRLFERIWLKTTTLGLALQPLTGIPLLMNRIVAHDRKDLSGVHIKLISDQYNNARDILKTGDAPIAFLFRIGNAPKPSSHTPRQHPIISWLS